VRVNNVPELLADDVAAAVAPRVAGLMVPKVDGPAVLAAIADMVEEEEAMAGMDIGSVRLLPIIETARGMAAVAAIAAAPRVHQLMIGELDLGADIGVDPTDEAALVPLRLQVVVASAAAGIEPPLGPVSTDFADLDALAAETRRLARQGFRARPAIHPAQVPVYNAVFTPSPVEVERARRLVDLYEEAHAAGKGAVVDDDGRMVDEAVVRVARRLLDTAGRGAAD
jgi:citrate lyase subunit beta/citryl-CoA lyase